MSQDDPSVLHTEQSDFLFALRLHAEYVRESALNASQQIPSTPPPSQKQSVLKFGNTPKSQDEIVYELNCPVCHDAYFLSEKELNHHVDQCLEKHADSPTKKIHLDEKLTTKSTPPVKQEQATTNLSESPIRPSTSPHTPRTRTESLLKEEPFFMKEETPKLNKSPSQLQFGGLEIKIKDEPLTRSTVVHYRPNALEEAKASRTCLFYQLVPGTNFSVDAFRGFIPDCRHYFLSHFHADHYGGLTKSFSKGIIYGTRVTLNYVQHRFNIPDGSLVCIDVGKSIVVEGVRVTAIDANHCPGAAMFLFELADGKVYLHSGDFRYCPEMETWPILCSLRGRINTLYLDTTYCKPNYRFPIQREVLDFVQKTGVDCFKEDPRTLFVVGSYQVGKEKVFECLSRAIGKKVFVLRDKYQLLSMQGLDMSQYSTTDDRHPIHVQFLWSLTFEKLDAYFTRHRDKFSRLVAFRPTGWSHDSKLETIQDIKPSIRGDIRIYSVPYSEHSSFDELVAFVDFLQPQTVIPTVDHRESGRILENHLQHRPAAPQRPQAKVFIPLWSHDNFPLSSWTALST
eukprot:TRINITY_DN5397_c0_g1_i4.p1 TRINITY_DN5397_c0_g1~~TRINITY_DN5397_c0_g1_i4.p1  ORF type:complete len:568 (+),score=79.15 TRINITY_DN5397_c0_g1_i4:42-1745(+)